MEEILARLWRDLAERPDGPLAMRFYLQPAMALFFAVRDGVRDAKRGKPAYLWAIFTHPVQRSELIRDGWNSISKVIIAAILLDTAYQLLVLKNFYPGETMIVAASLAVFPYALLRGAINRLVCRRYRKSNQTYDRAA